MLGRMKFDLRTFCLCDCKEHLLQAGGRHSWTVCGRKLGLSTAPEIIPPLIDQKKKDVAWDAAEGRFGGAQ
jgi:hypothetical protein